MRKYHNYPFSLCQQRQSAPESKTNHKHDDLKFKALKIYGDLRRVMTKLGFLLKFIFLWFSVKSKEMEDERVPQWSSSHWGSVAVDFLVGEEFFIFIIIIFCTDIAIGLPLVRWPFNLFLFCWMDDPLTYNCLVFYFFKTSSTTIIKVAWHIWRLNVIYYIMF